ncbi:MAG: nitroreductase [Terricaulis sp.]
MPLSVEAVPPAPAENEPANAICESAETLALLARRRSTKIAELTEPGPSAAQLEALIRLAARVPDHGKLGPWRFVIIEGEARERAGAKLADVIVNDAGVDASRLAFARGNFMRAPVCVMVISTAAPHPKIPEWEQTLSSAAACYGLLIAAHAMGFAGAWLTEWPTYDARAPRRAGLHRAREDRGLCVSGLAGQAGDRAFPRGCDNARFEVLSWSKGKFGVRSFRVFLAEA